MKNTNNTTVQEVAEEVTMNNLVIDLESMIVANNTTKTVKQAIQPLSIPLSFVKTERGNNVVELTMPYPEFTTEFKGGVKYDAVGTVLINGENKIVSLSFIKWDKLNSTFAKLAVGGVKGEFADPKSPQYSEVTALLIPVAFSKVTLKGRVKEGEVKPTALVTKCRIGNIQVTMWIKDVKAETSKTVKASVTNNEVNELMESMDTL